MDVGPPEVQYDVPHRPKQVLDPFLPSHHADVADQVTAAALEPLVGRQDLHALETRAAAHDEHALAGHPAAPDRDAPVGLVGGDRYISGAKSPVFELQQKALEESAPAEFRLGQFGFDAVRIDSKILSEQ